MSIKSHGGIFGRNPTFNNVEVESLTIAGNAVPDASTILVDGDIGSTVQAYDADTAKLDVVQTFTANQTFSATSTSLTNTTSAGNTVYINGYANAGATTSSSLIFQNYNAVPANLPLATIEAVTGSNRNNGGFVFKTYNGASNEAMQLTKDLNLELTGGGNVVLNSGAGIDFSATAGTGTSELFDDYEEGVHTVVATGSTSGTAALASTANEIAYTKVGNLVHVSGYLYFSSVASLVGNLQLSLPFTAADLADNSANSAASFRFQNVVSANCADFLGYATEGTNLLTVVVGNGTTVGLSAGEIQAATQLFLSLTYKAA
jgi:hypothetical protein